MKNIVKITRCLFSDPKKKIKTDERFDDLKCQMLKVQKMNNKIWAMVSLVKKMSLLQDDGGFSDLITDLKKRNYGQINNLINSLEIIQHHIEKAGRNKKFNSSKKGEEVTASKVFLGDIFDLPSRPASHWLERQELLKKEIRTDLKNDLVKVVTNWTCINNQAGNFVACHTSTILKEIEKIKTFTKGK